MDKKGLEKAIQELKKNSKERKFKQSYDLIVTLKDINLKNTEEQVDFFLTLSHGFGKKVKVVAFAGPELAERAKGVVDLVIHQSDFDKYTDKKQLKKMAAEYDFFIAQADIMPKVAQVFGRALGPRGKMPNPKLGSVIPGRAQVEPLYEKLQRTVRISAKKQPMTHVKVGDENMPVENVIENAMQVYTQLVHHLPKEKSNVRHVLIKLTMSKPVKIE